MFRSPISGISLSRGSFTDTATRSWCRLVIISFGRSPSREALKSPGRQKSDMRKTTARLRITWFAKSRAATKSVPLPAGWKNSISRINRRIWDLPFAGGMYSSTSSVNRINPTLSLFRTAENASTLPNSAIISSLLWEEEPNSPEALTSMMSMMVSSRSSVNFFTKVRPVRAVTFQSMVLTSSPGTYSRTSSKSMPRPLKTER